MKESPRTETATLPFIESSSHNILDYFLEGCQIISPNWRYLYVNEAAARQSRKSREDLLGRTMMETYPDIQETEMFSLLRKTMADRIPRQMVNEFSYPDGSTAWYDLRFAPVPEGVFILSLEATERKLFEEEQQALSDILQLINTASSKEDLLRGLLGYLKEWSQCEAVGIRLKEGPDYPYYVTNGFPEDFVLMENRLCLYDEEGKPVCDGGGDPILECMCGNILKGRFDPSQPFFTTDGSFWTNSTTELLSSTTEKDRQARTRNRCNGEGYESVALIPLRAGNETFGLLQFNDRRKGRFSLRKIALYRRVADQVANFMAKQQAEIRSRYLNNVVNGMIDFSQIIIGERDRQHLIQRVSDILSGDRGYHKVIIGLLDETGTKVSDFAFSHQEPTQIEVILAAGRIPNCCREALLTHDIVIRSSRSETCGLCPGLERSGLKEDTVAMTLELEGTLYGFMIVVPPAGQGRNREEQVLLRQTASAVSYVLRNIGIEKERDRTTEDLSDTRDQIRQLQKLEAIGQLAGGVAHDYNNILTVQLGYCELMASRLRKEDPLYRDLQQIQTCAERAASLTRQLLAFSRRQTLQPEVLDLNHLVSNIQKMLKRLIGEDIEFNLLCARDLARVKVDPGQIEQVIMNLAVNARDAMPQGGQLTLETANVYLDELYASSHVGITAGDYVMLAMTDTGSGIDESIRDRIFEPFFTTKGEGKGTGLGLATVYGIVRQSGGTIWLYSEPGLGTTFKIYLPAVAEKAAQGIKPLKQVMRGSGEVILVVEDEHALRGLFVHMIEGLGYRVRGAANGGEALLMVEEGGLRPDLLMTDVVMPGMSGKTLTERLLRIKPDLKILYMSGYADHAIIAHGELDPRIPFLQKPFNTIVLSNKLHEVLRADSPPGS